MLSRKNCFRGSIKSDWMSKSLWVMLAGIISFDGPPQLSCNEIACDSCSRVSAYPWMINVGQRTFLITSIFSNRSLTSMLTSDPSSVLTACFSDEYGDNKISAYMPGLSAASAQVGPDPIDLPIRMMSLKSYLSYLTKNWTTSSESSLIASASGDSDV